MAKWRYCTGNPGGLANFFNGATEYAALMGELIIVGGDDKAARTVTLRGSYIFSDIYVRVTFNNAGGASTWTLHVNGINTSLSTSVPASTTGVFEDTSNTASVVDTDTVVIEFNQGGMHGDSTDMSVAAITCEETGGTGKNTIMNGGIGGIGDGVTLFTQWGGGRLLTGNDFSSRTKISNSYTVEEMSLHVIQNNISVACTQTFFNTAVATSLEISIPNDTTGDFFDLVNTVSVVDNDEVSIRLIVPVSSTGSDTFSRRVTGLSLSESIDKRHFSQVGSPSFAQDIAFNVTRYLAIEGDMIQNGIENNAKILAKIADLQIENYVAHVEDNTYNAAVTSFLRVNGSSSALGVSIPSSTSGQFEDLADTIILTATDEINHLIDTNAASFGDAFWHMVGFEQKPPDDMSYTVAPPVFERIVEVLAY